MELHTFNHKPFFVGVEGEPVSSTLQYMKLLPSLLPREGMVFKKGLGQITKGASPSSEYRY